MWGVLERLFDLRWLGRRRAPALKRRHARPVEWSSLLRGEQFEDRCVPATFKWIAPANGMWKNVNNWTVTEGTTFDQWPGPGHKAVFDGTSIKNCEVDVTKVSDVEIRTGYTGIVSLSHLEVTNSFSMQDGSLWNVTLGTQGVLDVTGSGRFTWLGGHSRFVDFIIGSTTDRIPTGRIAGSVAMSGSRIINYGTFTWESGNITLSSVDSFIINQEGGTFEVRNGRQIAGSGFPVVGDYGAIVNYGTFKFTESGTTNIAVVFQNIGGLVQVYTGTVNFYSVAVQFDGTFELRTCTVKMAGSEHNLRIYDGLITGAGTVDGNLQLGYNPEEPVWQYTFPVIRPGIDGAIGTITVRKAYEMFAEEGTSEFKIDQNGEASKIVVEGLYAALNGYGYVDKHPDFKPPWGTRRSFMTYNTVYGDFIAEVSISNNGYYVNGGFNLHFVPERLLGSYGVFVNGTPISGGAFMAVPDWWDDPQDDAIVSAG